MSRFNGFINSITIESFVWWMIFEAIHFALGFIISVFDIVSMYHSPWVEAKPSPESFCLYSMKMLSVLNSVFTSFDKPMVIVSTGLISFVSELTIWIHCQEPIIDIVSDCARAQLSEVNSMKTEMRNNFIWIDYEVERRHWCRCKFRIISNTSL